MQLAFINIKEIQNFKVQKWFRNLIKKNTLKYLSKYFRLAKMIHNKNLDIKNLYRTLDTY